MRKLIAGKPVRSIVARTAVVLMACFVAAPAVASADLTGYFQGNIAQGVSGRQSDVSRSLLTSSGVLSNCNYCEIWAGAHYAGGNTLYANWATGTASACHNYGTANIGAMIESPNQGQNIFLAAAGWAGPNGSTYC